MTLFDHSWRNESRQVLIFGTGKGAYTARRYFEWDTKHRVVGHVVDEEFATRDSFNGLPVVAIEEAVAIFAPGEVLVFVPLGAARMNGLRAEKYRALKTLGYGFVSYVHGSNQLVGRIPFGENCFIMENQSVNFDARIGNNVTVWSGCQIGDRSEIGDNVFMASHVVINGDVKVGASAYLGSNSTISNNVTIGAMSFIGANALITKDTAERSVHVVEATPATDMDSVRFAKLFGKFM